LFCAKVFAFRDSSCITIGSRSRDIEFTSKKTAAIIYSRTDITKEIDIEIYQISPLFHRKFHTDGKILSQRLAHKNPNLLKTFGLRCRKKLKCETKKFQVQYAIHGHGIPRALQNLIVQIVKIIGLVVVIIINSSK
jgi:hypothetical protein